jgi:hypothetical protein
MKRFSCVLVLVIMFSGAAFAGEETSPVSRVTTGETSLQSGAFSLDVAIPDSDSGWIGGKYFYTNNSALECGLLFNAQEQNSSENQQDAFATEVSAAYVYYLSKKRISPYVKGGGTLSYKTGDYYDLRNEDGFGFLVLAGLGAEFFVTKEFSISAEAQVKLQLGPTCYLRTFTPFLKASFYF